MADTHTSSAKLVVLLLAVTMLTVGMPAMATHNSIGAGYQIMEADEVKAGSGVPEGERGTLQPDIGENLRADFHEDAVPEKPRPAPVDQSGERYTEGCDKESQATTESDGYNPADDKSDCYVGFMDGQLEYYFLPFWSAKFTGSMRYMVNPAPSDGYCQGSEDTENRTAPTLVDGNSTPDEAIARAERVDDDECDGENHVAYDAPPDFIGIDTDQLERQSTAAGEAIGTSTGSGTLTFPVLKQAYVFIFGEPYSSDTYSGFDAGEGPFGPNPAELGNPLHDLAGACGDRTDQCALLSPEDIKNYDTRRPAGTEGEGARVCWFMPQYFTLDPGALSAGACGVFGNQLTQYFEDTALGGLGATEQPTWINNLPGWHDSSNVLNDQSTTEYADFNCDGGSACHDYLEDGEQVRQGNLFYWAVNPKVPTPDHPLWCALPNFIGTPSSIDTPSGDTITDNGFYDYVADAIDSDIYTHFSHRAVVEARGVAHDPVRDVVGPIQEATPLHRSDVTSPQAVAALDEISSAEDAERQIEENFTALDDPIDRADPTESSAREDHSRYHASDYDGTTELNHRPFQNTLDKGLACKAEGVPELREQQTTQNGGVLFDVGLSHQTVNLLGTPALKDFTNLDDGQLPNEDDTEHGAWEAKSYSFGGPFRGVFDSNEDGEFDACTQALGQAQPSRDFCPWQPLWDAYNPACTGGPNGTTSCETIVNNTGYDNETGVGLYAVLHVTGPTVVYGEDQDSDKLQERLAVLGAESSVEATHCVVTTTVGFAPKLANQLGLDGKEKLTDELCRSDITGDTALIEDGFEDQGSSGSNGFGAQIEFLKLLPTPDAVREDLGTGFGADDKLCAHAVIATQSSLSDDFQDSDGDGLRETDDTVNNTRLEEGHNQPGVDGHEPYHFQDCDPLNSSKAE